MIPKTFVVPLDGSQLAERAVSVATPLAKRLGAGLALVAVGASDETHIRSPYLDAVAGYTVDVPVTCDVVLDVEPAAAICEYAAATADRMICMTTHGRGRLRWAMAGSVAESVIHESTKPLLLVGPHGVPTWNDPPGQIVVCVDGSDSASAAVDPACEWAQALECELTLAFVGHPLDVEDAAHTDKIFGPLEERVRAAGVPVHTRYERSSYVAGALLDVAGEPPATMLVMASRSRAGFARVALGSVTMGVLNSASCPVLVTPWRAEER